MRGISDKQPRRLEDKSILLQSKSPQQRLFTSYEHKVHGIILFRHHGVTLPSHPLGSSHSPTGIDSNSPEHLHRGGGYLYTYISANYYHIT